MSKRHYDLIVLGDSLASRVTAVLLAKSGCRVLRFRESAPSPSPWPLSSLHLEKLLDRLGGKSCLAPLSPFQVLTGTCRFDLHPPSSLKMEFEREFPGQSSAIVEGLSRLQVLGEKLENILLEMGGLPLFGPRSRARFLFRRLRLGLTNRVLNRPLKSYFADIEGSAAQEALSTLFAGLSLTPYDELCVAEGAVLWSGACRMEGASPRALEELLEHRYRQFHGEEAKLSSIEEARVEGRRVVEIAGPGGEKYSADNFLLGDPSAASCFPGKLRAQDRLTEPATWTHTAEIDGGISPLLAPRVIIGGEPPLRLSLYSEEDRTCCALEGLSPCRKMEERLRPLLPFASLELPPVSAGETRKKPGRATENPLLKSGTPLRLKRNLWLCHGRSLLPSLGTTGEVLLGISLAERLLRNRGGKCPPKHQKYGCNTGITMISIWALNI